MLAYHAAELERPVTDPSQIRRHRWSVSTANPDHRYHDFRQHPELIRTVLEDFLTWSNLPAVQVFYKMIEWLNRPFSEFETNDCGLRPIKQNTDRQFAFPLTITGRLMFFYRNLARNCSEVSVNWLGTTLLQALGSIDPTFSQGAIGIHRMPIAFDGDPESEFLRTGIELQMSFWAYGNSDEEVWKQLERVFENGFEALRQTSAALPGGDAPSPS
jgi:hypothetical protein